jgi:hypothetical protein
VDERDEEAEGEVVGVAEGAAVRGPVVSNVVAGIARAGGSGLPEGSAGAS